MLMDERATREAVAAYLFDIAARHMALAGQPGLVERCDQTAATLVSLRSQFGLHRHASGKGARFLKRVNGRTVVSVYDPRAMSSARVTNVTTRGIGRSPFS
jgi:hypothetical protein